MTTREHGTATIAASVAALALIVLVTQSRAHDPRSGEASASLTPAAPRASVPPPHSDAVLPTGAAENKWGPFEGRIIDAETGRGISGAAVIVLWKKAVPEPAGGHEEFYDASWAVSRADGDFAIKRHNPPWFRLGITGPYLSFLAPAYELYELTPESSATGNHVQLHEGNITVRLRRTSQGAHLPDAHNLFGIPEKRRRALLGGINRERQAMGLQPIRLLISGSL